MSFWRTYYHLVWATHERQALITPAVEAQLFPYLVQKTAEMGVNLLAVNGWTDHVHLVVSIPPKLAVAEVVKKLKGASARHLNLQMQPLLLGAPHFAWQEGYGVLTIGEQHYPIAVQYVQQQKEHHTAQQTNRWLECTAADDCGPGLPAATIETTPAALHEARAAYGVENDDDFPF
jgi:putative transposase